MPKPAKECAPSRATNYNKRKRKPAKLKIVAKSNTSEKDHLKWDGKVTAEILKDLGVALIEDVPRDIVHKEEPTPESRAPSCQPAPKIPRCGPNSAVTQCPYSSPSFSGASQNFMIYRRRYKAEEQSGEDPFTKLSDEIILHIFKWLPKSTLSKCALVCKRWKSLSYDETLWRRADLSRKCVECGVLGKVVGRGVIILKLAQSNVKSPMSVDRHLTKRIENSERFSKLQFLDLSLCCISPETLNELTSVCFQLKKISLEHCVVNRDVCEQLAANPNLEVINMAMCYGLDPNGIYAITSNCIRLQSWNLAWTNLSVESMNVLSQSLPTSLRKLNISGHREVLNDNHVAKIAERCPNLVEFDFSDSTQLTSITFEVLIHALPHLEALHSSRCYNISPVSFFELGYLKSLRCLTVYGMLSESILEALRQKLPYVEVNKELFSTISRPTVGVRRTSIWGLRVRD